MESKLLKRITWAEKDPRSALENGWIRNPQFCHAFFDRCEHLALVASPDLHYLALHAVEFANYHGDPHLIHRSHSVLAHAYINWNSLYWAGRTLADVRAQALACCPRCRSEHLRREGDLLGEEGDAERSALMLNSALEEGGDELDEDDRARIYFLRAIASYFLGRRGRALKDARRTLELMSLSSPRGYFLDTAAFLAIYLRGGGPQEDQLAKDALIAFNQRIKGHRGWQEMHVRSLWARAHIEARLGDYRYAHRHLDSVWSHLIEFGPPREAAACTLDRCILLCRPSGSPGGEPRGDNIRFAQRLVKRCLRVRPDLAEEIRKGLKSLQRIFARYPEQALKELVACRSAVIASVPSIMTERWEVA
ncbi:MAG: hypothetical protein AAF560_18605 [Acidobacteriota bacterium]